MSTKQSSVDTDSDYLDLTKATKIAPGRPSTNTMWRWARKGVMARDGQRVRLEHVRLGGKLFTTLQWIQEFGRRLAEADSAHFETSCESGGAGEITAQSSSRRAHLEQIDRQLREAGI